MSSAAPVPRLVSVPKPDVNFGAFFGKQAPRAPERLLLSAGRPLIALEPDFPLCLHEKFVSLRLQSVLSPQPRPATSNLAVNPERYRDDEAGPQLFDAQNAAV